MGKIHFEENDELFDIRYDQVFKAVFTKDTPSSRGALSKLVSALIGREVSVCSINANEPPVDNTSDRQIRYDISCRTESGELINVEMSLYPDTFESIRLEYYAGKLFTSQDIRGLAKAYGDLKEAYQITILGRKKFFPDKAFLHTFQYYDPVHKISLKGRTRIITLELSKVNKIIEKPVNEMSVQESWAVYFQYLTNKDKREKINEILEQEEGIAMASEVLIDISKDEKERARLLSELKYELDTQSKLVHAERNGIQKGLKKGLREGKQEGLREGKQEGEQRIIDLLKSGKSPEEIIREHDN